MNSVGADLLVGAQVVNGHTWLVADSEAGNTWVSTVSYFEGSSSYGLRIGYVASPATDAAHAFTLGQGFEALAIAAFSGAVLVSPKDQESGTTDSSGTSGTCGTGITPTESNTLLIAAFGNTEPGLVADAITDGFTIIENFGGGAGVAGIALAWKVLPTAAAVNPTWSWSTSRPNMRAIASFKMAVSTTLTKKFRVPATAVPDGVTRKLWVFSDTTFATALVSNQAVTAGGGFFKFTSAAGTLGVVYPAILIEGTASAGVDAKGGQSWATVIEE
jgi:hypothetical protein